MICDVHAHYTPKNFSEFMGDRFASPVHLPVKRGMARHPFSDSPGGHPGPVRADGCGRRREAGAVAEPPALSAGRGRVRQSGADAERRLCRARAPLSRAHRLLRDAAVAAYRRVAEGDGARLRPARLRRRQHEHHLPRPLGRRDRVRADLRRDEPARRGPVRASGRHRHLLAVHHRLQLHAARSAPRSRTRLSCCT